MMELSVIVFPAAMTGLFAAVVIYYLSKLLSLKDLEKTWKLEVIESAISVLLIVVIFSIIIPFLTQGLERYIQDLYGGSLPQLDTPEGRALRDSPAYVAAFRLHESEKYLENVRKITLSFVSMASSSKLNYVTGNTPKIGLSFGILKAMTDNLYNNVLNLLYLYLLSKKIFLVMPLVAELMIPVGVAFRAFPPTRGMGAYLIAFGLTFYLIFPILLLALVGPYPPEEVRSTLDSPLFKPLLEGVEALGHLTQTGLFQNAFARAGTALLVLAPDMGALLPMAIGSTFLISDLGAALKLLADLNHLMGVFIVDLLFGPYAAFGISLATVSTLSTILGGRIAEIGRGLVKFI